ncbi:MAG: PilT/PilU family type 4a pilus ATPase [Candidatus Marinimicrobia bacterium]|nr:PilT/PilU family type 4a pilus ATPase [Candidatus Neomarinimicrobiota bacterium]
MSDYSKELANLILSVVEAGGSDLHLSVGRHPTLRVSGLLVPLIKKPFLTPEDMEQYVSVLLNDEQKKILIEKGEADFAYKAEGKEDIRFRCNAFKQRGFWGVAMRLIPSEIKTLEDLNLPEMLRSFALKKQGFFMVVGPTGHGKSTTLASMVDIINHETSKHIVTIEDPIEYVFSQDKSIIDQREVSHDTSTFLSGLRSMFRQDIDVAMIGEMRDAVSISMAVTAAETGHLVFSSLHTNNASQTVDRIIDSFVAEQQNQIRLQLAGSLLGIFSQRLVPRISGGLIPAYELLIANNAVRNLIREGRTHELDIVMETSSSEGMIGLNKSLLDLVREGEITMDNALAYSLKSKALMELSK